MKNEKIVIIGGVAGGATAAARLRRLSEDYEIIMFEKDEYIAFANCGLPYYIGGVIKERSKLLVQTVEEMSARYNLDIRNFSEVTKIIPERKEVKIYNHKTKEVYFESYDKLIYSPGASPIVPDFVENNVTNIFTLRNIPDTDTIYNYINEKMPKHATVIGGGFIGIEMAENLVERGIEVTLIDKAKHILAPFDDEMVSELELELKESGINLILDDSVTAVKQDSIELEKHPKIATDMTILAIGVTPNSQLAKEANIATNERGGVIVDEKLQTSIKDIYAVGDVIATKSLITNKETMVPLASPANRQARVVADVIAGEKTTYKGLIGTSVLKVCSKTAASTGLTERALKSENINFDSVIIHRSNHAGYYPGSTNISLKLLFEKPSGKVLGAQAIGIDGVEKRIDVIATAINAGMSVEDLTDLELSYAPPFSSAKDPVNIAGYVATNAINDFSKHFKIDEIDNLVANREFLIDTRTKLEYDLGTIDGFVNIPLDDLRNSIDKLPNDKSTPIYVMCQVGLRGYVSQKILNNLGYTNVYNLSGGYKTYKNYLQNQNTTVTLSKDNKFDSDEQHLRSKQVNVSSKNVENIHLLDATGLQCPGPIRATFDKVETMKPGEQLKILVTDSGFCQDIQAWCDSFGHTLEYVNKQNDGTYEALLTKTQNGKSSESSKANTDDHGTIVMFSGDLDKALATMIIAQGAQAMGKQMTIFFTFWGLNVLRKDQKVNVKKTLFEKMFGFMMPRGANKLGLSQMNMAGLGSKMIKGRMKDKNVDSLPELIQEAQRLGVKLIACTMSMDLMGIKEEELIDNLEFSGVASYVGESSGADLTLFI